MIITEKHAKRLIREKKGIIIGTVMMGNQRYGAIDRWDKKRTDHYEITDERWEKIIVKWKVKEGKWLKGKEPK